MSAEGTGGLPPCQLRSECPCPWEPSLVISKQGFPQGGPGCEILSVHSGGTAEKLSPKTVAYATCFQGPHSSRPQKWRHTPRPHAASPASLAPLSPGGICQPTHLPPLSCPLQGLDRWLSHQPGSPVLAETRESIVGASGFSSPTSQLSPISGRQGRWRATL